MSHSRIDDWRRWLDDRITPEVRTMYLRRDVIQAVGRMVRESELPPSYFWQYLGDTYAATQAFAIRRQADRRTDVRSLARLIMELGKDAEYMTREAFLRLWPEDDHQYAGRQFDDLFAGATKKHLDPALTAADLKTLEEVSGTAKLWVDRYLAHSAKDRDHQGRSDVPTFDEISRAVDEIGTLLRKYAQLLTASEYGLHPILQNDWFRVFRQPWLRSGGTSPVVPPPGVF